MHGWMLGARWGVGGIMHPVADRPTRSIVCLFPPLDRRRKGLKEDDAGLVAPALRWRRVGARPGPKTPLYHWPTSLLPAFIEYVGARRTRYWTKGVMNKSIDD